MPDIAAAFAELETAFAGLRAALLPTAPASAAAPAVPQGNSPATAGSSAAGAAAMAAALGTLSAPQRTAWTLLHDRLAVVEAKLGITAPT